MNVTKDKVSSIFFKYSIPSVLGMLAISSASIVDGYFIGNYVGDLGLAAINISLPIFSLLFGLSLMLAIGGSVTSGKLIGEKDIKNASLIFTKTVICIIGFSFITCFLLFINIETILYLLGSTDDLIKISMEYMSILLIFLPFLMIGIVLDYFVRVDNRPNLAFIALLSSAVVHVLFGWILIVHLEKGIFGAALATGISELVLIIILLPHFFSEKGSLKFVKPIGNFIQIIKAAYNGASEFVNEISVGITILIFNYIAAFTIINYLLWIGIMISFGISDSLQPIISKNFGAKEDKRIEDFLKIAFLTTGFVGFLMIILILFIPEQLSNIFLEDSNFETKQIVLDFSKFIWIAFLFNGANLILSAYFTAVHKPLESIFIAISRSLIFPVIFIATLLFVFDKNGIFLAIAMAEAVTFIIAIILFKKKSK